MTAEATEIKNRTQTQFAQQAMEPDPDDNSPGAMLAHLWHTRRALEAIVFDLLPARGESLERLESKSAELAQHAGDFCTEAEEQAEPRALRVLARKAVRKTVSLLRTLLLKIQALFLACWVYLNTVCRPATPVPHSF